ncbi:hypothetical protein J4526_02170 [Desulfurococcaceae archaeon MEX13E-LK6-19]|nr:hypothetical protein J4526_02170 [Desulfurococcaceae archaeon MEX13E-LK6-19]
MSSEEIKKVLPIRVGSLKDLVRLAITYTSSGQSIFLLKFKESGKIIIGMLGLFRDYYKLYGLPVLYYHICNGEEEEKIRDANYIVVSTNDERIEYSKTPRPGISLPLVTLAEKPPIIPDLEVS